jgi:hypothetical protein
MASKKVLLAKETRMSARLGNISNMGEAKDSSPRSGSTTSVLYARRLSSWRCGHPLCPLCPVDVLYIIVCKPLAFERSEGNS